MLVMYGVSYCTVWLGLRLLLLLLHTETRPTDRPTDSSDRRPAGVPCIMFAVIAWLTELHRLMPDDDDLSSQHALRRLWRSVRPHCKKIPYISTDFVASFPHLNGTGSIYVYICRQNGPHCGPRFVIPSIYRYKRQTYMEPVPLKCGKLATKYPWIYIYGYFLQCVAVWMLASSNDRLSLWWYCAYANQWVRSTLAESKG